jgi:hypothetical protein
MPKANSVNHILVFRLASFGKLRYLLEFSGGKLTPPYLLMERGGGSQWWERLIDGAAGYSYLGSESDDKEGAVPRSRAAHREGKGTYIGLGRKETPSVGRPHKGRLY